MGLKSLFNRRTKQQQTPAMDPTMSSASSLGSHSRIEEELQQVFKKFDVNGDGKISYSELGSIMGSLGHVTSDEELKSMIKEVDSDGDGFIDLKEFIELNTKDVGHAEVLESLKTAFEVFDTDKNGSITADELQNVLRSLGDECSIAECRKMISGVDQNGDGVISFDEFKLMMMAGSRFDSLGSQRVMVD